MAGDVRGAVMKWQIAEEGEEVSCFGFVYLKVFVFVFLLEAFVFEAFL